MIPSRRAIPWSILCIVLAITGCAQISKKAGVETAIPADGLIVNGLLALWPSMVLYDRSARHPIAYDSSCMRA
jgi:hypothetical protein